jgi:shikimate kinase
MLPLPPIRCIVLIGFMGAGKSTIGALLAQTLGWRFLDSDTAIESRTGRTIARIFAEQGEAAFRALEAETIRNQVDGHAGGGNLVLALGGGAIENEHTRGILTGLAGIRVVFLDAPLEVMVARCLAQPEAAERPVLADRERLAQRFIARLPHYRSAHLTVATAELTPQAVVERILSGLSLAESSPASLNGSSKNPQHTP